MSDQLTLEPSTALAIIPASALPTVLAADKDDILGKLKAELADFDPDVSTEKGRREIASKAHKVARAKMDLVRLAGTLKEDAQARIKSINSEVRTIEERMDALKGQIRKPLDDFEAAEEVRVKAHEDALKLVEQAGIVAPFATSQQIRESLTAFEASHLLRRDWQEFAARAERAITAARNALKVGIADAERAEEEAREAERRRAEEDERRRQEEARLQQERETEIARQAAERARLEAEEKARAEREAAERAHRAEQERLEREKEEAERRAQAEREAAARREREAREAAERARLEAERKAREEQDRLERQAQAEREAAAQREQAAKEAAERAERERKAAEERAAQLEAQRVQRHKANIAAIPESPAWGETESSAEIDGRITYLMNIRTENFDEFKPEAEEIITAEIKRPSIALERAAELERVAAERQREAERIAGQQREERARREAAEAERRRIEAEQEAQRKEDERRAADAAHRGQINREAALDLQQRIQMDDGHSLPKELARAIITAIAKGQIRHVSISY